MLTVAKISGDSQCPHISLLPRQIGVSFDMEIIDMDQARRCEVERNYWNSVRNHRIKSWVGVVALVFHLAVFDHDGLQNAEVSPGDQA